MAEVIASAVALPEPEDLVEHPSENNLKRRQSGGSGDESGSKRRRTSSGKTSPPASNGKTEGEEAEVVVSSAARPRSITPVESRNGNSHSSKAAGADSHDARKKSVTTKAPDEKQRSKRLFGALLGNLNRPSDRTSKRRAEIEQRKKAELQKQDDERLEDRQRRLERLAIQRKNEQLKVDEHNMHIRHKNLLNNANFLQTRAEPKLYYRPWELLTDEEDLIEKQLKEAQEQVDRELVDWEDEQRKQGSTSADSKGDVVSHDVGRDSNSTNTRHEVDEKARDEEMAEVKMTEDSSPTLGANAPATQNRSEKPAEVPDSQPSSPQPTNSVVDGQVAEQNDHNAEDEDKKEPQIDHSQSVEEPKSTQADTNTDPNDTAKDNKDELDDDGDHVVEGDEDNVIY